MSQATHKSNMNPTYTPSSSFCFTVVETAITTNVILKPHSHVTKKLKRKEKKRAEKKRQTTHEIVT